MALQPGVDYYVPGPSKRDRLHHALNFQNRRSGNKGVLQLIKALNEPVVYSRDPEGFREFCGGLNRILRFYGVEYRDDGEFHNVDPTRTLSEAERRAAALENKMASRRVHHQVHKYCKAEYMEENYFPRGCRSLQRAGGTHPRTNGYTSDGLELMKRSFERPR